MRALSTVVGLVGLFGLVAGCAVATGNGSDEASQSGEALSTSTQSFVTVSVPECFVAPCPAYIVRDVNKTTSGQTIGNLDFSQTTFTKDVISKITSAPPSEIVLKGKLGPVSSKTHYRSFIVAEAYRGMPGVTYDAATPFYQGGDFATPVECFVAPCPEGSMTELNTTTTATYTDINVSAAAKPFVNQGFLRAAIASNDAVVVASFLVTTHVGAGTTKVLEAQQIFVKMPQTEGPCMQFKLPACPAGQARTYTRAANFCDIPSDCVDTGPCTKLMPGCSDGYTLASWPAAPHACPAFACDPTFIAQ